MQAGVCLGRWFHEHTIPGKGEEIQSNLCTWVRHMVELGVIVCRCFHHHWMGGQTDTDRASYNKI
jgi:hypothetical protein